MASNKAVAEEYARRASDRRRVAEEQERRFRTIGYLRLAAGIGAALLAFFVFGSQGVSIFWMAAPLGAFLVLVVMHARVVQTLELSRRALRFYEQGLSRVEDRWMGTGEQGNRFRDPVHVYAEDLDVFGKGSLYELLCTARTKAGEDTLASWLRIPAARQEVSQRQSAVAELTPRLELRENLALVGENIRAGLHAASLTAWGQRPAVHFPAGLPVAAAALSTGTILSLAGYLSGFSGRSPLLAFVFVQLIVSFILRPRVREVVEGVELPSHDLALLSGMLALIEGEPSECLKLRELQQRLKTEGLAASRCIQNLERLANRLEWTHNEFFKPIAAALMWSTQLAVAIERWRRHSGQAIQRWIDTAGEFEALCALAGYSFEHPSDPFPLLSEAGPMYDARGLGHPLLAEGHCVRNDVYIGPELPLMVISGSNMSGKSTLLRTVGLNCVLAWAGGPVRAERLTISPLQIGASIRVQDSLQDGRSRFYAEIMRLRQIVELTSSPLPVFFLLDELLSGTNSHDRQIGAAAIVKSLVERGALGMLTTHDLALAHIADSIEPGGVNVHFADTIEDGRLHFDYRLMPGVVERSNALELMRSVGLNV